MDEFINTLFKHGNPVWLKNLFLGGTYAEILKRYNPHSFIYNIKDKNSAPVKPVTIVKNKIIIPACYNNGDPNLKIIKSFIAENVQNKIIVDLRNNDGGSMFGLLAAFAPLLDNRTLFSYSRYKNYVNMENGKIKMGKLIRGEKTCGDVTVLVNKHTLSSAEILGFALFCAGAEIRGESGGMLSANMEIKLSGGNIMVLTVTNIATPGGRTYLKLKG